MTGAISGGGSGEAAPGAEGLSRRRFLQTAAGVAGALWLPSFRIPAASAQSTCAPPPAFPSSIALYQQAFENWSEEIKVDDLWTCTPATAADVVTIANWAKDHGYKVRPRGMMHTWSPLTVTESSTCDTEVVLVDTTHHLTGMEMVSGSAPVVKVGAGATMDSLLQFLEDRGLGFADLPAPGDVTIGGVLAINAHGASLPAAGEAHVPGASFGSLSNLIVSLTAVVWDAAAGRYALRTFDRSARDTKAFLTHLGRAFITEVTMRAAPNLNVRCQSFVDIPTTEMFAAPGAGASRTLASFIESAGRAEAIWFPFTEKPWLKVWSVAPTKPSSSREVSAPYNYVFSDNIPQQIADLTDLIIAGNGFLTPYFGQTEYEVSVAGLNATQATDLWGKSKNVFLYIKPTTLRLAESGYAIHTQRSQLQRVVSDYCAFISSLMAKYQAKGQYPINGPVEIRASGLDNPADVGVAGAEAPVLSALSPRADHPEWDVAIWLNVLTFHDTPYANAFRRELESWVLSHYTGWATARPEWCKGWAFTDDASWADPTMLGQTVPQIYRAGKPPAANWDWARQTLNTYDPHRIFSNDFLDTLLPSGANNTFTFKVKGRKLQVSVHASGKVALSDAAARGSGSQLKKKRRRLRLRPSTRSGDPPTITVPIILTNTAKRILKKKGKVTVNARITFTPEGGLANIQVAKLQIKGKKKHH